MTKSSPSIWHLLHNVKSTVKISSICVAFLENMNFKTSKNSNAKLLFLHQGPMSSRFKGDCAIKDRLLNWGFFIDIWLNCCCNMQHCNCQQLIKWYFVLKIVLTYWEKKSRIFLQSWGWTFAKYPFIRTVKLQSCTEYFFNLTGGSNQT